MSYPFDPDDQKAFREAMRGVKPLKDKVKDKPVVTKTTVETPDQSDHKEETQQQPKEPEELFQSSLSSVKPLKEKNSKVSIQKAKQLIDTKARQQHAEGDAAQPEGYYYQPQQWLSANDSISYRANGVSEPTLKQLKQNKLGTYLTLDLHGHRIEESFQAISNHIIKAKSQNIRVCKIIHGKGHLSEDHTPVLKSYLNKWLRENPDVLAFCSCPKQHGGTGAVFVLIRK